jgi:predicted phosphodiesterase
MPEPYKWLAFGCTHAPITDEKAWLWLIKHIDEYQPDFIIHLGDFLEGKAASRWDKDPRHKWRLNDEFNAFGEQVTQINLVAPKAKKILLYGNHDSNLLHEFFRMDDDAKGLAVERWERMQNEELKDWKIPCSHYGHSQYFRLGQVTFQHGGNTGAAHTDNHLTVQSIEYGVPFGLHVSAHTHAPVAPKQGRLGQAWLPYWVANTGTLVDWEHSYFMERKSKASWGKGLIRGTVSRPSVDQYKSFYKEPQWTAELLVHSWESRNRF